MNIFTLLFILMFVVAITESIMLWKWNATAFRSGLVIFRRKLKGKQLSDINLLQLESEFGRSMAPSMLFHKNNENEIFFREKVISFKLFTYTPIMHGHIECNVIDGSLLGRLNWFSIVFIIVWYSFLLTFSLGEYEIKENPQNSEIELMFIVFPILIFTMLYVIQSYRFGNIAKYINQLRKTGSEHRFY